jgi:hypothetical protein
MSRCPDSKRSTLLFTCDWEAKIMGKMASKAIGLGFVTLAGLLIVGCSSSSSSNGSTGGGNNGPDPCTTVAKADVQALLAQPITSVTDNTSVFDCQYVTSVGPQPVDWNPNDSDKSSYNNLSSGANDHQISGIGDEAYWNEPVPNQTTPELSAHKGDVTCVIQALSDPTATTLKVTETGQGEFTVTDADALTYVQLMGKVCNDYFAAL